MVSDATNWDVLDGESDLAGAVCDISTESIQWRVVSPRVRIIVVVEDRGYVARSWRGL